MAQPPVVVPPYPNVPRAPGVPAVARPPFGGVVDAVVILTSDALGILSLFSGPQWGIFDAGGNPIAIPDSIVGFDYRREYRVSDFPLEQGGFASYDKVQMPYDARVSMTCGGASQLQELIGSLPGFGGPSVQQAARSDFLNDLEAAAASLALLTVVTPEVTYASANIVHMDYRRTRTNGVTLLTVDLWLVEVRVTATAKFSNTQAPAAADPQSGGTVQSAPAPANPPAPPSVSGISPSGGPASAGALHALPSGGPARGGSSIGRFNGVYD